MGPCFPTHVIHGVQLTTDGVTPDLGGHLLHRCEPGSACIVVQDIKATVGVHRQVNQLLYLCRIGQIARLERDHLTACSLDDLYRLLRALDPEVAPHNLASFSREEDRCGSSLAAGCSCNNGYLVLKSPAHLPSIILIPSFYYPFTITSNR